MNSFEKLGLCDQTLESLAKKGFEEPTEIQTLTIPLILDGEKDLIAQAQTGTGKTAAFGLPLLEKVTSKSKVPQVLILAPTRELVIQICEEINSFKGNNPATIIPIYGGQSIELQLNRLKKGVTIVVGTPGRVLDHISRKTLDLSKISYFVLDEGDEMLNMGFIEDIETILEETPKDKRVYLFSATMPERIKRLSNRYMSDPINVKTKTELTTSLTDQIYFEVSYQDKFEALCRIIDIESTFYGIIFCRTKTETNDLASRLQDRGYPAEGLHGDISQSQREVVLKKFRKKIVTVLVATDVAARGIDITNLTHVINYSLPQNPESYVHRIGRTGRAGNQGTAVTFITPDEFSKLGFIKRAVNVSIERRDIPEIAQIISVKQKRISEEIGKIAENGHNEDLRKWAEELLENKDPVEVVAAVLGASFGKVLDTTSYRKLTPIQRKRGKTLVEDGGKTRLFIAKGKDDNITKRSLVEFIVKKAGTSPNLIDNIVIHDRYSFISVPFAEAEHILAKFKKSGKRSIVVKAKKK
ncbi:MAG: DEAD/DEAH box helicase [Fibrobacter sp.]|nr:DEAD/DEAH box helicase [Fibrobacter sp.]